MIDQRQCRHISQVVIDELCVLANLTPVGSKLNTHGVWYTTPNLIVKDHIMWYISACTYAYANPLWSGFTQVDTPRNKDSVILWRNGTSTEDAAFFDQYVKRFNNLTELASDILEK